MEKRILFVIVFLVAFSLVGAYFYFSSEQTIDHIDSSQQEGITAPATTYELLDAGAVLKISNDYHDYYFNTTSGVQFSNNYQDYWSLNVFCAGYKTTQWQYTCVDEVNFDWTIDNETDEINVTGTKEITIGTKTVRIGLRYHLKDEDLNLSVIPFITALDGDITNDVGFAWITKDIAIDGDTGDDYLYLDTYFNLSEPFNYSTTQLNDTWVYYGDYETSNNLWIDFNDNLNYRIDANENRTILGINAGTLVEGQTKGTVMHWLDAPCSLTCTLNSPSSDPNIYEGQSYTQKVTMSYSGTCSGTKTTTHQVFDTVWETIDATSNISTTSTNPQTHLFCSFFGCEHQITAVGEVPKTSYSVRAKCQYGVTSLNSVTQTVTVNSDDTAPNITLVTPENGAETEDLSQEYACFVEEEFTDVVEVQFWANFTGEMKEIESNTSGANNVHYNFTLSPHDYWFPEIIRDTNTFGQAIPVGMSRNGTTDTFFLVGLSPKKINVLNSTLHNISETSLSYMSFPYGVTENDTFVFVSDRTTDEIVWLFPNLTHHSDHSISVAGTFQGLHYEDGFLYVADDLTDAIFKIYPNGTYVSNFSVVDSTGSTSSVAKYNDTVLMVGGQNKKFYLFNYTGAYFGQRGINYSIDGVDSDYPSIDGQMPHEIWATTYRGGSPQDVVYKLTTNDYNYYIWDCFAQDTAGNTNYSWNGNYSITFTEPAATQCWEERSGYTFIPQGCVFEQEQGGYYQVS